MSVVTHILSAIEDGDVHAAGQLLPLVYDELRQLAAERLSKERPGQTLQATALVHDAYLRLVDTEHAQHWNSRGHFFAAAAEAMRRILMENARHKRRPKHGGDRQRIDLNEAAGQPFSEANVDLLAAGRRPLERLAEEQPAKAELVKLRYFAGLSFEEAAACLGISTATAKPLLDRGPSLVIRRSVRRRRVRRAVTFGLISSTNPCRPGSEGEAPAEPGARVSAGQRLGRRPRSPDWVHKIWGPVAIVLHQRRHTSRKRKRRIFQGSSVAYASGSLQNFCDRPYHSDDFFANPLSLSEPKTRTDIQGPSRSLNYGHRILGC